MGDTPGCALHVSDRTTAAMRLAPSSAEQAMAHSTAVGPRERLAEQLGCVDLAFRSVVGSTARGALETDMDSLPTPRERAGSGMLA